VLAQQLSSMALHEARGGAPPEKKDLLFVVSRCRADVARMVLLDIVARLLRAGEHRVALRLGRTAVVRALHVTAGDDLG
jgi:hypothetical protein